jgi:hypothetical protein
MKITSLLSTAALTLVLSTGLSAFAAEKHDAHSAEKKAPTPTESEIIAKARATYPLKTCLVSDESLGSMGDAVAYIHRATGQPDRVVFLCCSGCTDDFKADPAKFLAKVDAAAKAKK